MSYIEKKTTQKSNSRYCQHYHEDNKRFITEEKKKSSNTSKILQVNEKKIFFEKKPSSLFVKTRSSKQCADSFLKLMGLEIFNFWRFYGKYFFTAKLLIKRKPQKIIKIAFWRKLSHESSRKRVGNFRVSSGQKFFHKNGQLSLG